MSEQVPTRTTPAGFSAALAATVVWGLGNVIIARTPLNGMAIATYRLWMGAGLYLLVLFASGRRLPRSAFRAGWLGGVAFATDICAFFIAIKHTTLADATTINALQPVVILVFAGALFGEKIARRHIVCTAIAIVGIVAVVRGSEASGQSSVVGVIAAILSLFAWAWYFIASKQARQHLDTIQYMTVVMIVGAVVVTPFALIAGQLTGPTAHVDPVAMGWVALIVLLPGSGHLLINWAHAHTTITLSSLLTLLMPVISTAAGAWWLDQAVNRTQVIGIGIVLLSLAVVIAGDTRAAAIEAEAVADVLG